MAKQEIGTTPFNLFIQKCSYSPSGVKAEALSTYHDTPVSVLALRLVERWGMVVAVEDGEDSRGRAQARLLSPQEVVDRSLDVATLMYRELEKRKLITKINYTPNVKGEFE